MRRIAYLGVMAAGMAAAATVTVNPPAGTETNALAFVAGEDALAINPGATGGTVHLNPNNAHTGGTTLNSGTLVVTHPAHAGEPHELGAGPFTQTGGTLRYAGPAGGTWTAAWTNQPAVDTAAVVWQIDNDLVMAGDVYQPTGCFIKSGKGTLTFTQPFVLGGCSTAYGSGIYGGYTDFSPDRAPTKGYAPFTITDGTVVVDTPANTTNDLSGVDVNLAIGQGTTVDGEETTGVLILSNGVTRSAGRINVGSTNGRKSNSATRLQPTLRVVNGAELLVGPTGNKTLYLGVMWSDKASQWNAPLLEVAGSGTKVWCNGLSISYHEGGDSTVIVRDGGDLSSLGANLTISSNTGDANTTNEVIVTGAGSYLRTRAVNNSKTAITNMRILDGGVLEMWNFANGGGGKLNLIVDGGIWRHRNKSNDPIHFPSTMTSVKVGPGGMTTYFNDGTEAAPVIWEKGIEPLDDSGTDGGLHITRGAGAMPPLRMNAANTYCGPTEISFTRVYLGKNGRLPSGTALTIYGNNGGLIITNGIQQTVGSFSFGRDTATEGPILGFGPGARLDVTGELHGGKRLSSPKLHLFETEGGTEGLSALGAYTLVTARAEDANDLAWIASSFLFPLKPDGVDYTCYVTQEDGRALLKVAVTPAGTAAAAAGDPLIVHAPYGSTVAPAAAAVAVAKTIYANPAYADAASGTADLGALTGFAPGGTVIAGGGSTRVSDLSFVRDVTNLVIRQGSLVYTGASTAIPGFTVDTSANRSSVINVAETNTTLTISDLGVRGGSLTKMGPGTLHIGGADEIVMPDDFVNTGSYNGTAASGIGPANGARSMNVNEGRMTIGTLGDPADAPTVTAPNDFSVGSQSHRVGQGIQTSGELVMNNGLLYIASILYNGYYSGRYDDCPDIITHPTITVNGGMIDCNAMRIGQANENYPQSASPVVRVHAGTLNVRNEIYASYTLVPLRDVYRTEVTVDGTGLLRVGSNFQAGCSNGAAVDLTVTDNGRMEVSNVLYAAYNNQAETNTFRLTGNGAIRSRGINGNNLNRGLKAYFDGGTYESLVNAAANSLICNMQHAYIGAGGLNIDLSHQTELDGPTAYWLVLQQALEHDPDLGETPDGGITLYGAGTASIWTGFDGSTFTGPIRARDGARLILCNALAADRTAVVESGARLNDWQGGPVVKNLTLGTAGSSVPAVLELRRDVKGYGLVVTDALSVLSPVAVTTHSNTHDLAPYPVDGTYTALVYSAANADVDLSLFTSEVATATVSARQVTVADGGDYDGMKAVVVTIAGAGGSAVANGNTWTSTTAGGTWSDAANWANAAAGAPNGATKVASFNPATKAGVGVTLDEAVTLGGLTFNAGGKAYGYALSGAPLTLDNGKAGSTPATVVNASGTNTVASAVTLATDAELQTTEGNELRVTGGVSGDGDLSVNTHVAAGAGQVNLKVSPDYAGKVTTGSGRVAVDDLSFVKYADQLAIGTGTFLYTGPDAEIPGLRLNGADNRPCVFESDSDMTVGSLVNPGSGAFLKIGTGTLRLHGTDTLSVDKYVNHNSSNNKVFPNGDGPLKAFRGFSVSAGTFEMGVLDDPANAPTLEAKGSSEIGIGNYTSEKDGSATFVLNNGTVTLSKQLYISYYSMAGGNMLTFRQNGGQIVSSGGLNCAYCGSFEQDVDTLFEMNGGTAYFGDYLRMGSSKSATAGARTCRLVVNGGSLAFGGPAYFVHNTAGRSNDAFIDLNGGLFAVTGNVDFARYAGDVATLRLNPGATFRAGGITQSAADADTAFYGNGGTFQPIKTQVVDDAVKFYASTNGLVVDTAEMAAGGTFEIARPVLHDPALDAATDGGLVKRGVGTLTLSGVNTYTGTTAVEGGVLALSGAGTLGTGASLAVADGAACDLGGTAQAVGEVTASGLVRNGALTVTGALLVGESVLSADGDLTLAGTAAVDFAGRTDLDLAAGEPVAVVSGTATLPSSAKALNAGDVRLVNFVRDGTVIYALKASGGTVFVIR